MNNNNKILTTHYDTLGVQPHASSKEISEAYQLAIAKYRQQNTVQSRYAIEAMDKAYEVLSQSRKRKKYDKWLAQQIAEYEAKQAQDKVKLIKNNVIFHHGEDAEKNYIKFAEYLQKYSITSEELHKAIDSGNLGSRTQGIYILVEDTEIKARSSSSLKTLLKWLMPVLLLSGLLIGTYFQTNVNDWIS